MPSPTARVRWGLAAALLCGNTARAQEATDGESVARRALIDQATQSSQRGEHALALEQANRAAQIRNTPSLRFFIAREHLRLAQHVQALAVGGDCIAAAQADRAAPDRDTMIARCTALVEEAERSVGRLVVHVRDGAPAGLRVTVDERELRAALYEIPVPHEPRAVTVRASASGYEAFSQSIDVVAGATAELTIELRAMTPTVAPPVRRPLEITPPAPREQPSSPSVGPWVLGGVSVAAFTTSIIAGSIAAASRQSRDEACPSATSCDLETAVRFDDRYRASGTTTNIALVTGGALAIGAVSWWIIDRVTRRPPRARAAASLSGLTIRW